MSTQPTNQYTVISVSRIRWPYKRFTLILRYIERPQRRGIDIVVSGDPRRTCIAIDLPTGLPRYYCVDSNRRTIVKIIIRKLKSSVFEP